MESVQIIAPNLFALKLLLFILSLSWFLNRLRKKPNIKPSLWYRKLTSEWETVVMNVYLMGNEDHVRESTSLIWTGEGREGPFINNVLI